MDGLDEISACDKTMVAELNNKSVKTYTLAPEDFGIKRAELAQLKCASIDESKDMALRVLEGESGPHQDIVCLNAGAALYVAGKVKSIKEGVELAREMTDSGQASEKLDEIVSFTQKAGRIL